MTRCPGGTKGHEAPSIYSLHLSPGQWGKESQCLWKRNGDYSGLVRRKSFLARTARASGVKRKLWFLRVPYHPQQVLLYSVSTTVAISPTASSCGHKRAGHFCVPVWP